jgi:hypothetical protein
MLRMPPAAPPTSGRAIASQQRAASSSKSIKPVGLGADKRQAGHDSHHGMLQSSYGIVPEPRVGHDCDGR